MNQQQPQSRRDRRLQASPSSSKGGIDSSKFDLPGPLKWMSHPKAFVISGVIFAGAMVFALLGGIITGSTGSTTGPMQANEAPDAPVSADGGTVVPTVVSTAVVATKRYTTAPAMTIDPSKKYTATIKTTKGDITLDLDPSVAPQAVNSFVFLANDGYYNGSEFLQLLKNADGSKFYAQSGDPTNTGNGTPGFSIKKEQSNKPFVKGAVGMGGSSESSNGGQFFISYGDYPSLNGKYTIFGQVTSGMDVLDKLSLAEISGGKATTSGDKIDSVTITEK